MKLSVVITVYNEEENIQPLIDKLNESLSGLDYEAIFVDDGSTDKTASEVKKHSNDRIKLVVFYGNKGQTAAMAAGINEARGEYVVMMDGDLQNDPGDIPRMLEIIETEDVDLVAGRRANRKDRWVSRKLPSKIANWMIRNLSGVRVSDYGCSLKILKSDIAKNLGLYGEMHRFIPILASLQGARITETDVVHHPRIHGKSKYGIGRTFKVMVDLLLLLFFQKYLMRPMHLFGILGMAVLGIGVVIDVYLLILKIQGFEIWGRPILILGAMLTLGGIQLITIGIIAEMLTRTYYESSDKKTYHIREIYTGSPRHEEAPEAALKD